MRNGYCLLGLFTLFGLVGQVSAAGSKEHKETLSFEVISKLLPGKTSKSELVKNLGKPDAVVDFKKVPGSKSTDLEWAYRQKDQTRAAFLFVEGAEAVTSWTWVFTDGEAEQNLVAAQHGFPNAKWELTTPEWINPHAAPSHRFRKQNDTANLLLRRRLYARHPSQGVFQRNFRAQVLRRGSLSCNKRIGSSVES